MQRLEYSEAISCFQKALSGGVDSAKARRGLGMAYLGNGNMIPAWETFTQLLQESQDDSEVLQYLLQAGTALGYWAELCGILANYLERNPADCDMRYALAGVYYRAGVLQAAQEHCEILGTLVPDFEGLQDLQTRIAQALPPIYAIAK